MARLTLGEELIGQEHELIHDSLHLIIKQTYIEVTYQDGSRRICEPKDLPGMTADAKDFNTKEVQMTEAEFKALGRERP